MEVKSLEITVCQLEVLLIDNLQIFLRGIYIFSYAGFNYTLTV